MGFPVLRVAMAVARRPRLWPTALRQAAVLGVRPDAAYLAFRAQTQYGDPAARLAVDDVVHYLDWCRRFRVTVG